MKLIDRYLLRSLFQPLVVCLAAFSMIFIVHDLFDHMEDFIQAGTPLPRVLTYYLYLLPSQVVYIAPVSLLLAVLYSLSLLTKNNELTAMRASGVSLYRLLIPFAGIGLLFTAATAFINEELGPDTAYWCSQFLEGEKTRDKEVDPSRIENLPFKNELGDRIWLIGEFNAVTFDMQDVLLTQERPDGSRMTQYTAESAVWVDGSWWFKDITIQDYDENNHPIRAERTVADRIMSELTETPKDFINEIKYNQEFMSAAELKAFITSRPNLSDDTLARYRVDYHYRRAMPWTCFVVTLLGIPLGSETGRRGAFLGVLLSISMFFLLYIAINVGLALGKDGTLSPWLAGWAPVLLFGSIGGTLLFRMR